MYIYIYIYICICIFIDDILYIRIHVEYGFPRGILLLPAQSRKEKWLLVTFPCGRSLPCPGFQGRRGVQRNAVTNPFYFPSSSEKLMSSFEQIFQWTCIFVHMVCTRVCIN